MDDKPAPRSSSPSRRETRSRQKPTEQLRPKRTRKPRTKMPPKHITPKHTPPAKKMGRDNNAHYDKTINMDFLERNPDLRRLEAHEASLARHRADMSVRQNRDTGAWENENGSPAAAPGPHQPLRMTNPPPPQVSNLTWMERYAQFAVEESYKGPNTRYGDPDWFGPSAIAQSTQRTSARHCMARRKSEVDRDNEREAFRQSVASGDTGRGRGRGKAESVDMSEWKPKKEEQDRSSRHVSSPTDSHHLH